MFWVCIELISLGPSDLKINMLFFNWRGRHGVKLRRKQESGDGLQKVEEGDSQAPSETPKAAT